MASTTPFFKAFGPLLFGRPAKRTLQKIKRLDSLQELYEIFGHLLPERCLQRSETGVGSRNRRLSKQVTFWAFLAQILSPGTACQEIVRRIEAWWQETLGPAAVVPRSSTSAYCQARARLEPAALELIRAEVAWCLEKNVLQDERWLGGRAVKIVDGTGLSMPDTAANQEEWPQSSAQTPGCGFPTLKFVGLFSLGSGALLESATGTQHIHESTLFRTLWGKLQKGDIVLADRAFSSYAALAGLQQQRGVDSVMRLHQMRKADFRTGRRLGPDDRLLTWHKPQRTEAWTAEEYAQLPATLTLRMIRLRVASPGFRTKSVVLVTTLADAVAYPAEALRALYGRRWEVELHFQQIKTYLAMDILRCQSPEMIEREVLMHGIAYNLVRSLMQRSAHLHHVPLGRISFKSTLDTLRHWSGLIAATKAPRAQQKLINQMLALIASVPVPKRPGRSEPRAKKRRAKNYQLLTKPRSEMGNLPRRHRPKTKQPKSALT